MLTGIQNFLQFINDNWTAIIVIISLIIAIVQKTKNYFSKSNEEKIAIAKTQISETVLKLITDAEVDYEAWNKAGSIKRAQVIQKIFSDYPILSKVTEQSNLIKWIDDIINTSLKELREIVAENTNNTQNESEE
ncbi:MAG: hypothetical protein II304_03510 [Bacteroidales bacterium]|nr:hypothetical protein [Bacteroidales bacterium]